MSWHLLPAHNVCQLRGEFDWSSVPVTLPTTALAGPLGFGLLVVAVIVIAAVSPLPTFLGAAALLPAAPLLSAALVVAVAAALSPRSAPPPGQGEIEVEIGARSRRGRARR